MRQFSDEEIDLYFAVTECRSNLRRGVNVPMAVATACCGRDVNGEQVLALARKAHHACAQARHRYLHYRRPPAREIPTSGNRPIQNGRPLGLTSQTSSETV